jgi:gallate decarboxylase subunit D
MRERVFSNDMIEVHLGSLEENTFVSYRLERLGADWVLFITGGEPHIGSVACSEKGRAPEELWQITLGPHKEEAIVKNAALRLKDILTGEILVVGGIHYDNLNSEQIGRIEKNCEILLERLASIVINGDWGNRASKPPPMPPAYEE